LEHEGTRNASEKAKKDDQMYRMDSTWQETNLEVFRLEKRSLRSKYASSVLSHERHGKVNKEW